MARELDWDSSRAADEAERWLVDSAGEGVDPAGSSPAA
jgi:hypothetical protein